ncbi:MULTISPECIES: tryptophan 2,3-dioxygenase [unclassified Ruegeria]|uniref:tryptophan 2,3-dioxygenase n=1 Tax=unclassified Ruegeria TaxID=2625375 RepID=UPI0014879CA0|nr:MULTISPECIES: tryptophan 2,3-dioxygenase family protein [unclassified Ruegeria]NOD49384.1 tryptophan 2,3-dioxygenase [Ruegeria sp. HKCCD5849]NOD53317.1 tryptophan 2,3-dioxygenase [Ruegeria sp. HKCCD5851]NOD69641.1 tryptophan 2,3-dioxygenase [Ruegeria sp. HKCCD7303]
MSDKDDRFLERGIEDTLVTDFAQTHRKSYGDFLQLKTLLNLQKTFQDPAQPDEMLFIIIHQVSELWLKLMHHQLVEVRHFLQQDEFGPAMKNLDRVKAIQRQLIAAWETLLTMTPADYMTFRQALGNSSGFQSYGYRQIEFILGNKDPATLKVHQHDPEVMAMLNHALTKPSLYDEVLFMLSRQGFDVPKDLLDRDFAQPYSGDPRVVKIWLQVFRDRSQYWDLYALAEKLMDVESLFQRWRFDHVTAVERVIGNQPGTGGSSGVSFLRKALDLRFFHDLYDLRTELMYADQE